MICQIYITNHFCTPKNRFEKHFFLISMNSYISHRNIEQKSFSDYLLSSGGKTRKSLKSGVSFVISLVFFITGIVFFGLLSSLQDIPKYRNDYYHYLISGTVACAFGVLFLGIFIIISKNNQQTILHLEDHRQTQNSSHTPYKRNNPQRTRPLIQEPSSVCDLDAWSFYSSTNKKSLGQAINTQEFKY
jgi:hypothetical protein